MSLNGSWAVADVAKDAIRHKANEMQHKSRRGKSMGLRLHEQRLRPGGVI